MRDVAALRAARHGLGGDRPRDVAAAVRHAVALQAQDLAASRLGVRARTAGITAADVEAACGERREVVRTWLLRGTLHAVAADDAGWLLRLIGPSFARRYAGRRGQLGLDDATVGRALEVLPDLLGDRALTRAELVGELRDRGLDVDADGQAPAHLVAFASASGVLCRGPERGREPTYVLLQRWLGADRLASGPDGEAAETELARRYLAAYAPASAADLAAWAGRPLGTARAALGRLTATGEAEPAGDLVTLADDPPPLATADAWVLLPAFDTYLLGYADRDAILDPAHARRIQAGGGWLHPVLLHRGRVVARWRLDRSRRPARVSLEWLGAVPRGARRGTDAQVADVARFLGEDVALEP